jgi:ATP-dependent exoDNAse (exonuclease V) alpha subunit
MEQKNILNHLIFTPTKDQEKALTGIEEFLSIQCKEDFVILTGSAGTGKTSIVSAIIGLLNEQERDYKIAAPTGRAARIIGRKTNVLSKTIHSLIYISHEDPDTGKVTFTLKSTKDEEPTLYIVDEASMIAKDVAQDNALFEVQSGLLYDLIAFVKQANVDNKIIFIGDRYQLPPVKEEESFALNKSFIETEFNSTGREYHLTEVKRQKDGSYILDNANLIKDAMDKGYGKAPIKGERSPNIYKAAEKYTREQKSMGEEHQITISLSNKQNKFFNDLVRQQKFAKHDLKILEPGDLMMITRNWSRHDVALANGDHVKVLEVSLDKIDAVAGLHFAPVQLQLLFSDVEVIIDDLVLLECLLHPSGYVSAEKFKDLRAERYRKNKIFQESNDSRDDSYVGAIQMIYGNAITCHKAQGGEWEKVYINELGIPNLKWQYTAVTRAKNNLESFGKD